VITGRFNATEAGSENIFVNFSLRAIDASGVVGLVGFVNFMKLGREKEQMVDMGMDLWDIGQGW
jgi:hypothetical protein